MFTHVLYECSYTPTHTHLHVCTQQNPGLSLKSCTDEAIRKALTAAHILARERAVKCGIRLGDGTYPVASDIVAMFSKHKDVELRVLHLLGEHESLKMPIFKPIETTKVHLSLHEKFDMASELSESEMSDSESHTFENDLTAGRLDLLTDLESVESIRVPLISQIDDSSKKQKTTLKFPYLTAMHGNRPVHAVTVGSKFFGILQGDMYAHASNDRRERVRQTLMRNDPLPTDSIHEYSFVIARIDGVFCIVRLQSSIKFVRRPGGPRFIPWPFQIENDDSAHMCLARVLMFQQKPAGLQDTELRFTETFCYSNLNLNRETVIALLRPAQFKFDVITHQIKMPKSLFESLCNPLAPQPAITEVKSSNEAPTSGPIPSIAGHDRSIALPQQRARCLQPLTSADLQVTDNDYGFSFDDFNINDIVIVHFKAAPIPGKIIAKSKRAGTFAVDLETDRHDRPVTVSFRVIQPLDFIANHISDEVD